LEDPSSSSRAEASQLRLKLQSVRAEIAKRDAALALLPGGSAFDEDSQRPHSQQGQRRSSPLQKPGVLEEDGFVRCIGKNTLPGQDAYKMVALDINECKRMCREGLPSGEICGAFVVQDGRAYFRSKPVSQCREHLVNDPLCTTYLNSSAEAAALCAEIRRAVVRRQELRQEVQDLPGQQKDPSPGGPQQEKLGVTEANAGISPSTSSSGQASESFVWRESISLLEGELRRKSAHGLELHRRVHQLEAELQTHLQANDSRIGEILGALEAAESQTKALGSIHVQNSVA